MKSLKNILTVAALAFTAVLSTSMTTLANDGDKKVKLTDEQVNVQYVGSTEAAVQFRVEFENPTAAKFWLIIKNDNGDILYRKQFSDVHFNKTVSFSKEESEIHPTFIIRNGDNEISRQFSVTRSVVENTVVTKL